MAQQDLIVRLGNAGHHQAKYMQECAGNEEVARAIVVEDLAGEDAASKHEENCSILVTIRLEAARA